MGVGMSHEQLTQLRNTIKESGTGVQGHSRSPVENARALLHIHSHQECGLSFDAAVKATAAAELASPSTLRAAAEQFSDTGTLPSPRTPVSRSNPLHPFYLGDCGPSLAAQLLLHRHLHEVTLENTFESCNTLRTSLAAELGVVVSKSTVCRWLHALGYQYGRKHFVNSAPSYRWALIRRYIYRYAKALKEQEDGSAIIVYMDESYIHARHCSQFLWFCLSSATKNEVRGESKGKRIIIMHAMTKDGLLEVAGTEPSNILTELYHSCALIFDEVCVDDVTPADYHDTITGEKFIGWLQQRLFPTVRKQYPGKKMYLVLDVPPPPRTGLVLTVVQDQGSARRLSPPAPRQQHHCRGWAQHSSQQVQRGLAWTGWRPDAAAAPHGRQGASHRSSGDQHHGAAAADGRCRLLAALHSSLRQRTAAD